MICVHPLGARFFRALRPTFFGAVSMFVSAAATQAQFAPDRISSATFVGGSYATATIDNGSTSALSDNVYSISVNSVPANPWDVMLSATNNTALQQGDVLIVRFRLRSTSSTKEFASVQVVFETNSGSFPRSLEQEVKADSLDRDFAIPFVCGADYAVGAAKISIRSTLRTQAYRITQFKLEHFARTTSLNADTNDRFTFKVEGLVAGDSVTENDLATTPNFPAFLLGGKTINATSVPRTGNQRAAIRADVPFSRPRVYAGDVLVLFCYLRDSDPNDGVTPWVTFRAYLNASPYTSYYSARLAADPTPTGVQAPWRLVAIPFVADRDFPVGGGDYQGWRFGFDFAPQNQKIQIAGVRLVNLGKTAQDSLGADGIRNPPFLQTRLTSTVRYGGSSADASWRQTAATNIDTHRRANLAIRITDANGATPTGTFSTEMTEHAFGFGMAVTGKIRQQNDSNATNYQTNFGLFGFNKAVHDQQLKWSFWINSQQAYPGQYGILETQALLNRGIRDIRGHATFYGGNNFIPPAFRDAPAAQLKTAIEDHASSKMETPEIDDVMTEWDVINEPWSPNDNTVLDNAQKRIAPIVTGGRVTLEKAWLDLSLFNAPRAKRYVNDFDIEGGAPNTKHLTEMLSWAETLIDAGAGIDGFGLQSHFKWDMPAIEDFLGTVTRFNALNNGKMRVAVTEYDHTVSEQALAAEYLRDYLTAAFSHPAIDSFLVWGFWDGDHWLKNAPFYFADWQMKPAGRVWQELVLNRWWSRYNNQTITSTSSVRVYKGAHRIDVTSGDFTKSYHVWLTENRTVHLPFVASASVPSLAGVDLGASTLGQPGSTRVATPAAPVFTLRGSGVFGGNGTDDGAHVATKLLAPNQSVAARMTGFRAVLAGQTLSQYAKAGLVARQSLDQNSPLVAVNAVAGTSTTPGQVVFFVREKPASPISAKVVVNNIDLAQPVFLKLDRSADGNTFTASYRANGATTYTTLGTATLLLGVGQLVPAGPMVSSNTGNALAEAKFDSLSYQ